MNPDAIVLALIAIADLSVLVQFRKRHALRAREERVSLALKYAVQRANGGVELVRFRHHPRRPDCDAVAAA